MIKRRFYGVTVGRGLEKVKSLWFTGLYGNNDVNCSTTLQLNLAVLEYMRILYKKLGRGDGKLNRLRLRGLFAIYARGSCFKLM